MKPHKIILTCFALLVLGVCSLVINTSANAAICHNGGRADYRGLIKYTKAAKRAKSHVECDTILIDQDSASDTFPVNDIETSDGTIEHEAHVSKISEAQLYLLEKSEIRRSNRLPIDYYGIFGALH